MMGKFMVQQWVKHASQYEDMDSGDFKTADEAIAGMNDLIDNCGFVDLRVVDEDGSVIAESN